VSPRLADDVMVTRQVWGEAGHPFPDLGKIAANQLVLVGYRFVRPVRYYRDNSRELFSPIVELEA